MRIAKSLRSPDRRHFTRASGSRLSERGAGFGKALLVDGLMRALTAADAICARAILVHAIDEEAASFYKKIRLRAFAARSENNSCCL